MKPVRLYGDPFGSGAAAAALRACLDLCCERGFTASLCLSAVRPGGAGARTIELGDGSRTFGIATDLSAAAVERLRAAAATPVPATAPVVVFAPQRWRSDLLALAGLEWPQSCAVLAGDAGPAAAVLDRVGGELAAAGTETPPLSAPLVDLLAWAALPPAPRRGQVLHVADGTDAAGSDVAVRALARAGVDCRLRVVLPPGAAAAATRLGRLAQDLLGERGQAQLELRLEPLTPALAADCVAVLQPLRRLGPGDGAVLAQLLASGRPVVATRFCATAAALGARGTCVPVGGTLLRGDDGSPWCEPDLDNVVAGLRRALDAAAGVGRRGREHAITALGSPRPAAPSPSATLLPYPPARPADTRRPVVVLEAPWFETSSTSELSIATAQALLARGNVDLRLWPVPPFRTDLGALRRRAPGLERLLVRDPGDVDLWLASGWPPRSERPRCRAFAIRLDWEYGALPTELLPLVTQEADAVVVHSRHVARTVAAAGCSSDRIALVPHGVDGACFRPDAAADPDLLAWKAGRPAVLFVGGMVFRKGFDLFLRAALAAAQQGVEFVVVVKAMGSDGHYAGFHLGELAARFAATRGAPPLRIVDGDLDRPGLASLYRACDLLLHPYRGEGFGLPVLEARATGLPVLVTRGGACDDFAVGKGVVPLPAVRRALALDGAHRGQPWLLEPDAGHAGDLLASSLRDLERLRATATAAAAAVRREHTWDRAAAGIEQLLRLVPAGSAARPEGASVAAAVSRRPTPAPL